jgi:hypothetical protein
MLKIAKVMMQGGFNGKLQLLPVTLSTVQETYLINIYNSSTRRIENKKKTRMGNYVVGNILITL